MTVRWNPLQWFRRGVALPRAQPITGVSQPAAAADVPAEAEEKTMNFGAILALVLKLAPVTVLTIQKVVGDSQSGADKKTMAQDALSGATSAALSVLGGEQSIYSQLASAVASEAIDASVAFTKVTGAYQKATADAKALQPAAAAAPAK